MKFSPFAYLMVPVEWIALEKYQSKSTRKMDLRKRFRWYSTKRKPYWVQKQKTIWPKGWNSQWPGQPVTTETTRKARYLGPEKHKKQKWTQRSGYNSMSRIPRLQ